MVTMQNIGCREGESCNERIMKEMLEVMRKQGKKDNPAIN